MPSSALKAFMFGAFAVAALSSPAAGADFTLSSPDLASGTFDNKFILNGFGCIGSNTDFQDTGATGVNGNLGGPRPAHGTASLYSFVLNKGVGPVLLGKASFTATYGR